MKCCQVDCDRPAVIPGGFCEHHRLWVKACVEQSSPELVRLMKLDRIAQAQFVAARDAEYAKRCAAEERAAKGAKSHER